MLNINSHFLIDIRIRIVYWWNAETTITHQECNCNMSISTHLPLEQYHSFPLQFSGPACLGLGIWFLLIIRQLEPSLNPDEFSFSSYTMIGAGIAITLYGLIGCLAIFNEHRCLLGLVSTAYCNVILLSSDDTLDAPPLFGKATKSCIVH